MDYYCFLINYMHNLSFLYSKAAVSEMLHKLKKEYNNQKQGYKLHKLI